MVDPTPLLVLLLLFTKHLFCDYFLQNEYQLTGKGIYGHGGGLLHSGLHGIGTFIALLIVLHPLYAVLWGLVDSVIHYHVDWAKVKLTTLSEAAPTERLWWILFGADQHFHAVTYIAIVWAAL